MSSPSPYQLDAWPRRERRAVAVLPYAMLAFTAVLTVIVRDSARETWLIDLALCGLAAVWMLCLYTLVPAWRDRDPMRAVFFTGLIAIMTVLIIRDPWSGSSRSPVTSSPSGSRLAGGGCSASRRWRC
jgi:hypothetical protein